MAFIILTVSFRGMILLKKYRTPIPRPEENKGKKTKITRQISKSNLYATRTFERELKIEVL